MALYLPVSLNITGHPILMIGGGSVALHKLNALLQFTSQITCVAESFLPEVLEIGLVCKRKSYDKNDLEGFGIIYACTNNRKTNASIRGDARRLNLLVNVADAPELCDFISPAIYKNGPMTIAVSSGGTDVKKAVAWRNKIQKTVETSKNF